MPMDMTGPIRDQVDKRRKEAQKYQAEGNKEKATQAYRQCAELMRQLAGLSTTPEIRKQRLQSALDYEELAKRAFNPPKAEPTSAEGGHAEDKDQESIDSAIEALIYKSSVTWNDIGGLETTKEVFKEAYALAIAQRPEGVHLPPWRAILLYGPPGTGKTMLAAAASNGLGATFFNVRLSSILSKYFGESTKLLSALYVASRERAPSLVYLDEFESIGSAVSDGGGPEGRILATLRAELDGLASKDDPRYVLTIAVTNEPWKLDKPILSRFKKVIYVPLPDQATRQDIFNKTLKKHGLACEIPPSELASRSEGYSGREIDAICDEAISIMVKEANPQLTSLVDQGRESVEKYTIRVRPLTSKDFDVSLSRRKPRTTPADLRRFDEWARGLE